ncbi:DUF3800 domain-containing protein [Mucilaginibacter sp. Mucisp84]|uniref:DUF3800 domain-containing protein n=1 Tax=Mucilaginibacter sp. Mucisp84 TaxID=3243058 RepID=UPI0039A778F8
MIPTSEDACGSDGFNLVNNSMSFGAGNRSMPLKTIIKDPIFRDSKNSYFHQLVDVVAYFARQHYEPNNFIKKRGARRYYELRLQNVTNKFVTRRPSPNNIVEV